MATPTDIITSDVSIAVIVVFVIGLVLELILFKKLLEHEFAEKTEMVQIIITMIGGVLCAAFVNALLNIFVFGDTMEDMIFAVVIKWIIRIIIVGIIIARRHSITELRGMWVYFAGVAAGMVFEWMVLELIFRFLNYTGMSGFEAVFGSF